MLGGRHGIPCLLLVRCKLSYDRGLLGLVVDSVCNLLFGKSVCNMFLVYVLTCRVNFRLKSDTDLFTIVKCKTAVSSIEVTYSVIFVVIFCVVFLSLELLI